MSFINYLKDGKKARNGLILSIAVSLLFLASPQKTLAYAGVLDISFDPFNIIQTTSGAISGGVSAGSNTVTASMTTADKIKQFILDPAARVAAKILVKKLTTSTVNWMNSGFQGNPSYVTDPGQFFLGVADDVASTYLSGTALNQLCSPFKAQVRLALVKNYLAGDNNNYSCTLSRVLNNYDQFTQDFSAGGWDAWFEVTQVSGNNPYGAYLNAQTSLNSRINSQINKYTDQVSQGRGFLNFEQCKTGTAFSQADIDSGLVEPQYKVGDCYPTNKETVTPGAVLETQLQGVLGTDLKFLELAKSFDEIIGAIVTGLITRVTSGGGLRGDGRAIPPPSDIRTDAPTIIVQGSNPMFVATGARFNDPGAIAYDTYDASVDDLDISNDIVAVSDVDTTVPGTYSITYNVTNSKGVAAKEVKRVVNVGLYPDSQNACVTLSFSNFAKDWPRAIDSYIIELGRIKEQDIEQTSKMMIEIVNNERLFLISKGVKTSVTKLEEFLEKLDSFYNTANFAEENSIKDILNLERERATLKAYVTDFLKFFDCNVGVPPYAGGPPIPGNPPATSPSIVLVQPTVVATISVNTNGQGTFPDPVYYNGRVWVGIQEGPGTNSNLSLYNFAMDLTGQQIVSIPFSRVGRAFQRLGVYGGVLWMIYRDGENSACAVTPLTCIPERIKLWRSDTGAVEDLGPVTNSGNRPVAIGTGFIFWQAQTQPGSINIFKRSITGGQITNLGPVGLPTGINRVLPNGSIVMYDTDLTAVPWGVASHSSGPITVATDAYNLPPTIIPGNDDGVIGRFNNGATTEFNIWQTERAHDARAATDGNGNYIVTTWNPDVRVAILKWPPVAPSTTPSPTPTPTPPPVIQPVP
ncbi:MAG: hypothetical protein A2W51_01845 [Candidatus Zambryskibacteria bacterium RIFCSPHIGHO2_02_39_10]|nr:MAG: hypothetical protein A2W51_01845 [Candidatus Zambryskibacteria bacterium RIFCSPHIGHO2_02_39_10]